MKNFGQSLDFINLCKEYNLDFEFPEEIKPDMPSYFVNQTKVCIWNKSDKVETLELWGFDAYRSGNEIWGMLIDAVISRKYDRNYKGKLFNE